MEKHLVNLMKAFPVEGLILRVRDSIYGSLFSLGCASIADVVLFWSVLCNFCFFGPVAVLQYCGLIKMCCTGFHHACASVGNV